MSERLDKLTNLAVIGMSVTITGAVIWTVLPDRSVAAPRPNPYLVGEVTDFKDAGFESSDRTLLLVVSSSCEACTKSLPFYRNAVEAVSAESARSGARVRIVAAVLDPLETGIKYLNDHGVEPEATIRMPSAAWRRIRHTPTLLLVDRNGAVIDTWVGLLSPEQQKEVLERLIGAA